VQVTLTGRVATGAYQLVYRPQALPTPDQLVVNAASPDGGSIVDYSGAPLRRSVIDRRGITAWR